MKRYTKLFNLRTNELELRTWRKRAEEVNKDLSSHIRHLLKEDILKTSVVDDDK